MPQYGRPESDITKTSFVNQVASSANLWNVLDEVTPDNADFIVSNTSPVNNVYVCKLSSMTDPLTNTGHVVNFTYARSVDTNAEQIDLIAELRQNYANEASQGTHIANTVVSDIPYTWTANTITLTLAQAESITDYANLFLRFVFNTP
jgi:hypothetical protein